MSTKPTSLVSIIDNVIPFSEFATLKKKIMALGTERLRETYQTTFWFHFKNSPSNLIEQCVANHLTNLIPTGLLNGVIGVEWWLSRMRTSNVKVDFHVDRDNHLFDSTQKLRHPRISSLLYLNSSVGGLLAVTKNPINERNLACAPDEFDFDFVKPKANRFTFFVGNLTHGVLDSHNEIPGPRRAKQHQFRHAIAINFWTKKPLNVNSFSESSTYRRLQLRQQKGQ